MNKEKFPGTEHLLNSPAGTPLPRNNGKISFSLLTSSGYFQTCFRYYEKALHEVPCEHRAPPLTDPHSPGTPHNACL